MLEVEGSIHDPIDTECEQTYLAALGRDMKHLYRALRRHYEAPEARAVVRALVREVGGSEWYIDSPRMRFETDATRQARRMLRRGLTRAQVQAETGLSAEVMDLVEGKFLVAG